MSEHTKGPWTWDGVWIEHAQGDGRGPVASVGAMPSMGESLANARLIAASPCMLLALERFVAFHNADHEQLSGQEVQSLYDSAIKSAKDAIRKATGDE